MSTAAHGRPPTPEKTPIPGTPAERFGRRMFDFADLLLGENIDKRKFGHLMHDIAEDLADLTEAEYYDRVKEATDLLPMTRAQARTFAEKVRRMLAGELGGRDDSR